MNLYRVTTNGMMYTYKNHLQGSQKKLQDAMIKVQTSRNFNSYAEDPAAASKAWALRRAHWRNASQITNNDNVIATFQQAYDTIDQVKNRLGYYIADDGTLVGLNGPDASGRQALGQAILEASNAAAQSMNTSYAGNFIFAGADGQNAPFSWDEEGNLCYRGINVNTDDPIELQKLKEMNEETTYVDVGLGMDYLKDGEVITSTVYNSALSGIDFLNYGVDEDGDPKNTISIMKEIGELLYSADQNDGHFPNRNADEEKLNRLCKKLQKSLDDVNVKFVELSTKGGYLKTNATKLNSEKDTLNEQILGVEHMEEADAITNMAWAQYCYNAALKIGTNILSESLIDYMR